MEEVIVLVYGLHIVLPILLALFWVRRKEKQILAKENVRLATLLRITKRK